MGYGEKIYAHPDKNEITERLLEGESVRDVASWLKGKYPNNKRRWISYLTLQRFRTAHLNLKGKVLSEIKSTSRSLTTERFNQQRDLALEESPAYEKAKLKIATDVLSREQLILDLQDKAWQRIKMLESEDLNYKTETVLVQYLSELRQLMSDYHKMLLDWEKLEKGKNGSQVNVQVVMDQAEEQVNQMKIIVKEVLQEMEPSLVPIFLDKVNERVNKLQGSQKTVNVQVNNHGS